DRVDLQPVGELELVDLRQLEGCGWPSCRRRDQIAAPGPWIGHRRLLDRRWLCDVGIALARPHPGRRPRRGWPPPPPTHTHPQPAITNITNSLRIIIAPLEE